MNRIFKVLWNAATGTFVVTSETAKSRGKKSGRRKLAVSALIGLSSIMISADALAKAGNDTGAGVTPTGTQTGEQGGLQLVPMPQPILTPTLMAQAPQWVIKPPRWGNGVPPLDLTVIHLAIPLWLWG